MEKNNGRYIAAGILVAVILIGWWTNKKPNTQNLSPETGLKIEEQNQNGENPVKVIESTSDGSTQETNKWEGMLKTSDNSAKGNLMLVNKDHTIYLRTSRDFSSLIDKNVEVTYQGSLESFKLGEIKAK